MADEPLGMRPGEDDRVHARVAVDAVHQRFQLVGDLEAEQPVRATIDARDQNGAAVLDIEVPLAVLSHRLCLRGAS